MIDLSVNGLVKSFDLEKNILDGVTFQIERGERVGLLGKNGAGKTTLFRILTGELRADEGDVIFAPNRRVGLISQIPVYPDGYTVEDVLQSAFARTYALGAEMAALSDKMANGEWFATVDEALPAIRAAFTPDTAMLVKASHSMHFEKITEELTKGS